MSPFSVAWNFHGGRPSMDTFTRYRAATYHPNPVVSSAYQKSEAQRMRKSLGNVTSEVFRLHRSPVYNAWREKLLPSQVWGHSRQGRVIRAAKQKAPSAVSFRGAAAESTRGICHTHLPSPETARTLSSERKLLREFRRSYTSASALHQSPHPRPPTRAHSALVRSKSSSSYIEISPEEVQAMDNSTIAAMLKSKQQAAREIEEKLDQTLHEVQVLSQQQHSRPETAPQRPHGHLHFTVPAKPVVGSDRPSTAPHGDVWQEYSPNRMVAFQPLNSECLSSV